MILFYFVGLSFLIFGVGLAGVAATRHFILMILSVEIILSASILLSVAIFVYSVRGDPIALLFSISAVAASEIMGMVTIYRYMSKNEISMDVGKLSKLRD